MTQHDETGPKAGPAPGPPATPALFAVPAAAGPDLDALDERLAALGELPVAEHPALYSDLHAELSARLQATER